MITGEAVRGEIAHSPNLVRDKWRSNHHAAMDDRASRSIIVPLWQLESPDCWLGNHRGIRISNSDFFFFHVILSVRSHDSPITAGLLACDFVDQVENIFAVVSEAKA